MPREPIKLTAEALAELRALESEIEFWEAEVKKAEEAELPDAPQLRADLELQKKRRQLMLKVYG